MVDFTLEGGFGRAAVTVSMAYPTLPYARLRRAFDRAARTYDEVAVAPREIARRMVERLDWVRIPVDTIVDAGCGTGYGELLLHQRYRNASLVAVDLSEAMLQQQRRRVRRWWQWFGGRRRRFSVCADFRKMPLRTSNVDLVWSNLALHWSDDLAETFAEIYRVLRPGGLLTFSVYGPDTLRELRESSGEDFRMRAWTDMHDIGDLLVATGFAEPVMDMEQLTLTYADLPSLLSDLRRHGTACPGAGQHAGLRGRSRYLRLLQRYEHFRRSDGRLPATLEVVYGHAWKAQPRVSPSGQPVFEIKPVRQ